MNSMNSVASDVLQLLRKALCLFQATGVIEAYSFSHTEVLITSSLDKYIENLIVILEELKLLLEKLYGEQSALGHRRLVPETLPRTAKQLLETCDQLLEPALSSHFLPADHLQMHQPITTILASQSLTPADEDPGSTKICMTAPPVFEGVVTDLIEGGVSLLSTGVEVDREHCDSPLAALLSERSAPPLLVLPPANHCQQTAEMHDDPGCSEGAILDEMDSEAQIWPDSEEQKEEEKLNEVAFETSEDFGKVIVSKQQEHNHIHIGVKPFCCEHCGKLFSSNVNLSAHHTRQHNLNTETAHSCSECGKLFTRKSALDMHLSVHRGIKPFKCYICGRAFTQKVTRDVHIVSHTGKYEHGCAECGRRFATRSKLNAHNRLSHSEAARLECSLCGRVLMTARSLSAHHRTHNVARGAATHCMLETAASHVDVCQQPVVGAEGKFECRECRLEFRSQRALTRHGQSKHNVPATRFQCRVLGCSTAPSFSTRQDLNRHIQRHHDPNRKRLVCEACGKEFLEKSSLAHHMRQKHTPGLTLHQRKPHACQLCAERFTKKSKLTLHLKTHTQEPLHCCDVCGKRFHRRDQLTRHSAIHSGHSITCLVCGRSYTTEAGLRAHVGTHEHNGILCSRADCTKTFKTQRALQYHLMTHDGNFRYECGTCSKRFVRKCHYLAHERTHSMERPYKCLHCTRAFKDRKHWREHIKRLHAAAAEPCSMQSLLDSIGGGDEDDPLPLPPPLPSDITTTDETVPFSVDATPFGLADLEEHTTTAEVYGQVDSYC